MKTFFITLMAIAITSAGTAQVLSTKNISLDAAKKIVTEAVKFAERQ